MTDTWARYIAARPAYLAQLGAQVKTAARRIDTDHPAFHGCIDWHSAVHGTYALLAISRLTGDPTYREVALAEAGGSARIAAEEAAMYGGDLQHEVPYGMAWALHLVVEAAHHGVTDFHELGIAARHLLMAYLPRYGAQPYGVRSRAYRSTIWATDALLHWAEAFDDGEARDVALTLAEHILRSGKVPDGTPTPRGVAPDGFFSPCHLWLLLALRAGYPASELTDAIDAVRDTAPYRPEQLRYLHSAGLNFSRSWGCHAAWALTGDARHRDNFASLVIGHMALPEYWRDDYEMYGHWVAQFGVFAIALTETMTDKIAGTAMGNEESE